MPWKSDLIDTEVGDHCISMYLYMYFSIFIICKKSPLATYTGPKVEEVAIFWQMVMEHKPAVVVMLTNVEENGKVWLVFLSLQLIDTK